MRSLADNSVDAVVTDPPYHLTSPGSRSAMSAQTIGNSADTPFKRNVKGFMGKQWDGGDIAQNPALWSEVLRVLKPGGHCVAFSGTRTYHRMACAIEDAGFEVRDQIQWIYAQGFPKSLNVSNVLGDERCRCEETTERDLRAMLDADVSPAQCPGERQREILFAGVSEPCSSAYGEKDGPRLHERGEQPFMEGRGDVSPSPRQLRASEIRSMPHGMGLDGEGGRLCDGASPPHGRMDQEGVDADGVRPSPRSSAAQQRAAQLGALAGQPQPQMRGAWDHCERCGKPLIPDGLGTALKPSNEPICLARKPLSEKTVAANVLRWGTGAINVDGCRIPASEKDIAAAAVPNRSNLKMFVGEGEGRADTTFDMSAGRFPANLCHDGSDEVLDLFPESKSSGKLRHNNTSLGSSGSGVFGKGAAFVGAGHEDEGSAARFFYCAKASKADRALSKHPTVKPVKLMQWLCRMVTPPGGMILDPFAGSGTTGQAALNEGFNAVLIEREAEYIADIERRLGLGLGLAAE